jgi:hypothetical protein
LKGESKLHNDYSSSKEKIMENEIGYNFFFQSYLTFLMDYFPSICQQSNSQTAMLIAEKQLVSSLMLMEKIHMHMFMSKLKIGTRLDHKKEYFTFPQDGDGKVLPLFHSLVYHISNYEFLKENHKLLCENSIKQITNYYLKQETLKVKILNNSPPSSPWKPKKN